MKIFHLFTSQSYYPSGGMEDYEGAFETIEDLETHFHTLKFVDNWEVAQVQEDGALKVIACNLKHTFLIKKP